ncbi:four-carbon acid sugar kinase family protein [Burkholderia sp. Bp9031]|uniref:four-carbon acid sugar kinase family protein n=1 Tax=Burkholderia sp. Bp9031 TaxID=2184566 RepID=UPI000F5FE530|nr:four-carbon acid sugar kinase family protein [Burkholderia sp. Bp9031]RQZ18325.1 four-carbon acid sugar kinase family protein [Burkholderia sp. Bp9031]
MQIRIITDDFTSALDGTASFAERGWATAVLTRPDSTACAAVVSLDTDTRENPSARDSRIVADAAQAWRDADVLVLQFDSTLRGRVALDCKMALAASGRRKLLIAPAFPSAGRTTEAGAVFVHGVPVHETEFGRDPTLPVRESDVSALFRASGIDLAVAQDAEHARELLEVCDAVVVDARTETELDAIAGRFAGRRDLLLAGSTGLVRALARGLPRPGPDRDAEYEPTPLLRHPSLVVGSLNPRSRRQLDVVRSQSGIHVLATRDERLPAHEARQAALHDLVTRAVNLIRSGTCDGLVVTGGETARRIVDALPALSLRVCREILPGIPLAEVRTADGTFPMITKAGGFGDDDALLACIHALTLSNEVRP